MSSKQQSLPGESRPGFTPGPWEVTDIPMGVRHAGLWIKARYGWPGDDESLLVPASVVFGTNAVANANLIAAAPDLYAALKKLADYASAKPKYVPVGVYLEAITALAKAEGRTP